MTGGGRAARPRCGRRPASVATVRSHDGATTAPHQAPSAHRSVPSSPRYSNAVPCRARAQLVALERRAGTGPLTSRNVTRRGRSKRTVSTVVTVRPGASGVKCAASTRSAPRSITSSLPRSARGVRPRYGAAMMSNTSSGGAAMSSAIGPSGRSLRPMPMSSVRPARATSAARGGEQGAGDGGAQRERHRFVRTRLGYSARGGARHPARSDSVDLPALRHRPRRGADRARRARDSAARVPGARRDRGARVRRQRTLARCAALRPARRVAAAAPDRGRPGLPARLRHLPGARPAHLPRDHRGQHRLQPRLPGLLRRVGHRPPARRLLALARAGRVDAGRVRRRRGAARGGAAVGRRAVDPPADPRHAGRREGARDPARDAQHQRHPARARRALRARAGRDRRPRLPPVRRL